VTTTRNGYCAPLGIDPPRIDDARSNPDVNYYTLLLVILLERGESMTLEEQGCEILGTEVQPARLLDGHRGAK
jgi:hypothetical protein